MVVEVTCPGVQDRSDAELTAEPFGIPPERSERLGRCLEKGVVVDLWLAPRTRSQATREGEDDVAMPHRQHACRAQSEPLRLLRELALRTVAVMARVVGRPFMRARVAGIEVASERGRATRDDILERPELLRSERVGLARSVAIASEDFRDVWSLSRGRIDRWGVRHAGSARLQQRREFHTFSGQVRRAHVQVAERRFDARVPEKLLDSEQIDPGLEQMIDPGLEQMGGMRVTQDVRRLAMS